MKKKTEITVAVLIFIILFSSIVAAQQSFSFGLMIDTDENVNISFIEATDARNLLPDDEGPYSLRILDSNEDLLYSKDFNVGFIVPGLGEVNESFIYWNLPYHEEASSVEILHENRLIFSANLEEYLCNNDGVCEQSEGETHSLCPQECFITQVTPDYVLYILIIVTIIGAIAIIVLVLKRKKKQYSKEAEWQALEQRVRRGY
jgi:hypothetical protein